MARPDLVEASYLTYCFGAANTIFTVPLNWGGGFCVPGSSLTLDKSIAQASPPVNAPFIRKVSE